MLPIHSRFNARLGAALVAFALPVSTEPIVISQMWHPRLERDPGHRWLRGLVLAVCRETLPPSNC